MFSTYTHKERNAPTMHPAKRQFVLSSIIALFRFAPTVLLLRNQHGLQIAKILFITNLLADQWGHDPIFAGNTAVVYLCYLPAISILLFYSCRGTKRWNRSLCVAFCNSDESKKTALSFGGLKNLRYLRKPPQNPSFSFAFWFTVAFDQKILVGFQVPKDSLGT